MPRRIEVELTSSRDDGTWTWRAAGARQPKGSLDGGLLYQGAKVGDVLRVDAEFDVEGITIINILPPREERRDPERLEIVGSQRPVEGVTTSLASRDRRDRPERPDRGERGAGREGHRGRPRRDRGERSGERDTGDRPPRPRRDSPRDADQAAARSRRDRPESRRPQRPPTPPPESKPKPKRLRPGRTHRSAVVAELPAEHRPIAEQVLRGGIPAVRQAVDDQNAKFKVEGKPEIRTDALVALAEDLLPRLRTAEWRDRADAALADAEEVDLRDLRSVVVAADDAARDEESRELAARLRTALTERVDREHANWLDELRTTLDDGRVVRALRLSSRPPKAGARFPAELATRLADVASAALSSDVSQDRWAAVVDAVAYSPVRRAVRPQGIPTTPGDALLASVRKLADRVPDIAGLFGIEPAPPSRPPSRRGRGPKGPRRGGARPDRAAPTSARTPEGAVADAVAEAPAESPAETVAPPVDLPAASVAEPRAVPPPTEPATAAPAPPEPAVAAETVGQPMSETPPARREPVPEVALPPAEPDPHADAWDQVLEEPPMGSLRKDDDPDDSPGSSDAPADG